MTTLPKRKPSARKQRTHIPALEPAELEAFLARLQATSQLVGIDREAQQAVADILRAASNPFAETTEGAIASLDDERRQMVDEGARELQATFSGISQRASGRLLTEYTDADWERLLDESE